MPARKLAQLLDEAPALRAVGEASRHTEQLQRIYLEAVPVELSRTSRISWAGAGVLFVAAGNGAVAAKLRQLAPRILDHFRSQAIEFNSMRIEVQAGSDARSTQRKQHKPLSENALSSIRAAQERIPESPLKSALERLGRKR